MLITFLQANRHAGRCLCCWASNVDRGQWLKKHIFTETVVIITILQLFTFTFNDDKENTFTFKIKVTYYWAVRILSGQKWCGWESFTKYWVSIAQDVSMISWNIRPKQTRVMKSNTNLAVEGGYFAWPNPPYSETFLFDFDLKG